MDKYNVYIRYTVETKVTVEAESEQKAMDIAHKLYTMASTLEMKPVDKMQVENAHRTIWKTEKAKK